MKHIKIIAFFVIFLCGYEKIYSIADEIIITEYSYREGLTTNIVNSTFRDSKGFLWITSINGLYRYDGYSFIKIQAPNKLLNGEVFSVIEDENNNLWISTAKKGIVYYNTYTEELFALKLDVNTNYNINKIFFFKNLVWLATDSGIVVFEQQKNYGPNTNIATKVILPEPSNPFHQRNKITYFYVSNDSTYLWIGTNGGLFVLNTENNILKVVHSHPQNAIRCILPYKDKILAGSWDGGVFLVHPQSHTLENNADILWINQILEQKRVIAACYDRHNKLWIATYGDGLYQFDITARKYIFLTCQKKNGYNPKLKSDIINHIQYDRDGILWLSMNQPSLTKIYFKEKTMQVHDLEKIFPQQSFEISCLTFSNILPLNIWIGTTRNGLIRYDFARNMFYHYLTTEKSKLKLPNNEISLAYEDKKGNLWLVHRLKGLYVLPFYQLKKLNTGVTKVQPIDVNQLFGNPFINTYITCFYEDSKDRLWVGFWGALYVIDFDNIDKFSDIGDNFKNRCRVYCIFSDESSESMPFPISPTQAIVEIDKNTFFIGTRDEGLVEIKEKAPNVFSARIANEINSKLPGDFIRCFYKNNDSLWIGTNVGICLYDLKSKKVFHLDEYHGLSSNNINAIVRDSKNNLWVSSSYGISKILSHSNQIQTFLFETEKNNYNYFITSAAAKLDNGIVSFSTNKAVVYFHPDSLNNTIVSLPLLFTNVKLNNELLSPFMRVAGRQLIHRNINECDLIKVPYNSTLNLEFAALDFIHAEKIKYKFRINENEWIALERNQRNVSFYNQIPGEYRLTIMALHPSGNTSFRSINLLFLPPWWKTIWAYLVYFIVLITIVFTYRNLIIQRFRQQAKIEQEKFERLKLEELDKLKTNFITNLSHEIRTPLSLIINPLETIVKNNSIGLDLKNKIQTTLKNSYRLVKLTNELSDYTKIEKELLQPEFKYNNVIDVVKEVSESFKIISETTHIDFQFITAFDQYYMYFDKEMVEKIIFNLLSNAFKFTPQYGSVVFEITENEENNNKYIQFSVTNTGEGIPEDKVDKIFDRFYQINSAQQGLGIGLSIVKSLVEMHKGMIRVKSIPGVETCFDVLLCTDIKPSKEEETMSIDIIENELKTLSPIASNTFKVLIIEDDEEIRQYIFNEFSNIYKMYSAANGEYGLQIAAKIMPDIIITDIIMPGIDGIEVCKRLRADISTSHIPIIILSAKSTTEQQIEGLHAGANIYIVKPFNIYVLKSQIDRLIQLKDSIYKKFLKESEIIPSNIIENELDIKFINKVVEYIERNLSNSNMNVDELAKHVCLSKVQLYRKIKAITGLSIIEFITSIRLKTAAKLILENRMNYAQIAYETGFSSPSYFTKCFREYFGKTPSEYSAVYKK